MALWKPFRGNRADLDSVEKHDGYVYFCIDDATLFFDYANEDGILQRKQINAKDAETLTGMSLDEIKESIVVESTKVTHGESLLSNILETYILTIDYETLLAFDTSEIVTNRNTGTDSDNNPDLDNGSDSNISTTSILGKAILGQMVLA